MPIFAAHTQTPPQLPSAVAQTAPKPAAGWVPLQSFSPLQSAPSVRVPFGYVPGAISVEMPKGRTPPLCVYFCWMPETYSATCSTEGASSKVSR